jgi:hypothetical protein
VERVRVLSDGNVGIGTAVPSQKMHVVGNINLTGDIYKNGVVWNPTTFTGGEVPNQINVGNANGYSIMSVPIYQGNGYYSSILVGGGTGGYCVLFKNDAQRTIDSEARTATLRNDDGRLRLMSTNAYTQVEKTAHTAGSDNCTFELYSPDTGDSSKEVSLRFHQGGRYYAQIRVRYGTCNFYFTYGGTDTGVPCYASSFTPLSSIRYKENIVPYARGVEALRQIAPKTFTYKGQSTQSVGVIAEEMESIGLTEFVMYNGDNQPEAVNYDALVMLCVNAIKQQQAEIEALRADVLELKAKQSS